jgi:DNA invertase Pin-like site-specific DNA recombinase
MFFDLLLGNARVTTDEQTTRLQLDALEAAGCERAFSERASGAIGRGLCARRATDPHPQT